MIINGLKEQKMKALRNGSYSQWFSGNKHRLYSQTVMRCVSPGKCWPSLIGLEAPVKPSESH